MAIERLYHFVQSFTRLIESHGDDEAAVLEGGQQLIETLIAQDDWLPDTFAQPHPDRYQQYLLHCDPLERFSVVSFVWGPRQSTPVHDHTVWGLVGVLRGEEYSRPFRREPDRRGLTPGSERRLVPGEVDVISPRHGDIHAVRNGLQDRPSISIHVYGANIGAVCRHTFDVSLGSMTDFISGYNNAVVPNIWDRSRQARA